MIPTNSLFIKNPSTMEALRNVRDRYPYETHPAHSLAKKIIEGKFNLKAFLESIPLDMENDFSMGMFYKTVNTVKELSHDEKASILGICSNCLLYPNNTEELDPNFWKSREVEFIVKTVAKNIEKEFPHNN